MKKKPEKMDNGNYIEADSQESGLTRRAAIKRLAKVVGGAVVGSVILGPVPQSRGAYSSFYSSRYSSRYSSYSSYSSKAYNSTYRSLVYRDYSSGGYRSGSHTY